MKKTVVPGSQLSKEQSPEPRRAGGRPPRLTLDRILDAARQVPARELTMPIVARRLGVDPSALYYHFESRDALLAALSERLVADFRLHPPAAERWREWLLATAAELHRFLLANPVILAVEDWSRVAQVGMPLIEDALETLEGAGFDTQTAWNIWSVVTNYAYSNARSLHDVPRLRPAAAAPTAEALFAKAGRALPRTHAMAVLLARRSPAEVFDGALRWLVGSLPEPPLKTGRAPSPARSRKR